MDEKEDHLRHIVFFFFRQGKKTSEVKNEICTVYGDEAIADVTVRKWYAQFKNGNFDLNDSESSGDVNRVADALNSIATNEAETVVPFSGNRKSKAAHPSYADMVKCTITALNESSGSSHEGILKYIMENYQVDSNKAKVKSSLHLALKKGVSDGILQQMEGVNPSGLFRLSSAKPADSVRRATRKAKPVNDVAKLKTQRQKVNLGENAMSSPVTLEPQAAKKMVAKLKPKTASPKKKIVKTTKKAPPRKNKA